MTAGGTIAYNLDDFGTGKELEAAVVVFLEHKVDDWDILGKTPVLVKEAEVVERVEVEVVVEIP